MALAVALLIFYDGLHHGDLSVHRAMIVQSVTMHSELGVYSVWLVGGESNVSAAVIRISEFFLDILEEHDVRNCSLIEPYFSIVFDVCFPVGLEFASISLHSHGFLSFPDLGD